MCDAWLKDRQTALHVASRVGDVDVVKLLVSRGASLNAITSDHYTPLHIAAKEGHDDIARLMLDHGVLTSPTTKVGVIGVPDRGAGGGSRPPLDLGN